MFLFILGLEVLIPGTSIGQFKWFHSFILFSIFINHKYKKDQEKEEVANVKACIW